MSRVKRAPEELIRFVVDPEGRVVADLGRRLPGRGVWVTAERSTVAEAVKRNAFVKSFRSRVVVPADLPHQIERLLLRRVADALSLSNKAGLVTTGFTRIEAALGGGAVAALVHGTDAAEDGAGKLDRIFRAVARDAGRPAPIIRLLNVEELSLALGRSNVVHAALSAGGATNKFLNEASRVVRFRSDTPASSGESAAP